MIDAHLVHGSLYYSEVAKPNTIHCSYPVRNGPAGMKIRQCRKRWFETINDQHYCRQHAKIVRIRLRLPAEKTENEKDVPVPCSS